ncbi:MAG: carboxypeptidase regulatory-like domain-containing protein, partial [Flavobacterium sp.]
MELRKILEDIAVQHGVKFSFIEEDVKRFSLIPPPTALPLKAKLNYIATRTGINYREAGNYIAIYIDINLPVLKICGYLRDENNDPIQDASIRYASGKSISTDAEGYFEMPLEKSGKILVSHPAFDPQRFENSDFNEDCK